MFVEQLMGSLIGGALGLRGKRHHRAHGFFTAGPSSFLNTSTLLTAAGVAATAYTLYRAYQTSTPSSTSTVTGGPAIGIKQCYRLGTRVRASRRRAARRI